MAVRVGTESSGHGRWFERLLHELGFELWIGDAAEIRTKRVTVVLCRNHVLNRHFGSFSFDSASLPA